MNPGFLGLLFLAGGDPIDFDRDVLPILSDHCFHCHGPDAGTRQADLRLDVHDDVLFVAEPGEAASSEVMDRVLQENPKRVMPPPEFQKPLSTEQIDVLRRWIDEGVVWESHWAYAPVKSSFQPWGDAPVARMGPLSAWEQDPLDEFVLAHLLTEGLSPSPEADPGTWFRRVNLDLTGLPPTVDALESFLSDFGDSDGRDGRQAVREAAVDALLESEAHAEHRTREWLDLARYADTNGYQNDFRRDQWPWRDWVLRSFAENMPYDRFVAEQVAGDLLPDADEQSILATGFQRNHRTVTEAGSIDEEWRVENVADRAETTATAFLGLTLACARCHDHKYDALTQKDYYRFYGFFNSIDEKGVYTETRGNVPPIVRLYSAEVRARLDELEAREREADRRLVAIEASAASRFEAWRASTAREERPQLPEVVLLRGRMEALGHGAGPKGSLDLGTSVAFHGDEPFSVSLWLKPESHGAVYSRMNDDDSYRGTDLVLLDSMKPAVHLIHSWSSNAIKVIGKQALERGRWQHVAVTYDGSGKASGVELWLDGVLQEVTVERDALDGAIESEAPLLLGTRRYAGELAGEMADFRVDGVDLDPAQVLEHARHRARGEGGLPFFMAAFDFESRAARVARAEAAAERARVEREDIPTAMVLRDLDEPRATYLLDRGRYDKPVGEPLEPDVPEVFGGLGADAPHDRLGLARWLTSADNPLTPRVAVNRVWASFFGEGLVATRDDFGVRGDRPESPGLLDYLSHEFVKSGWDLRALERRIALSSTYGQSSAASADALERDPRNRLLARGPRHRLDAETIRDQALLVAGLLVQEVGGPSVKPYQPDGLWKELAGGAGQGAYVPSVGNGLFRRSLYTYRKRTVPHPTLTTFDAPGFELCSVQRARTNTPLQALATLNGTTYIEAARHLGQRMMDAATGPSRGLQVGGRAVLARDFSAEELALLESALARHTLDFSDDAEAVQALLGEGATAPPAEQRTAEWAAYTMIASTLLNLDEALTKR
ncbi:Planctomycete cytochrome C [Planctomycetes bacterium Poly30]|uniref:Planctomycete cytochrome C n=1 Tax=Saltatorellus ferox TaxID=2528018 RepID=A0A518F072_9BACT|nr:Planctomycete cytochrome C [Planctomycetes bacterium Poly30]